MPRPATADERERRIVEYLVSCHKGRLGTFRLTRMNRVAIFRKQLIALIDEMIDLKAEERAAAMLIEFAPPRPEKKPVEIMEGRLPLPPKRVKPVWIKDSRRFRVSRKSL